MRSKVSQSRRLAYEVLERVRRDGSFANDVIDKVIDKSCASKEDKAYSTRLSLGVVSSSGALDYVINRFLDKASSIKGKTRTALRIATYEIIYLGKDAYAAVDQCVELTKEIQPRAVGLANAVMRKVAASSLEFPYGNPETDLDAYALLHAFPEWLVRLLRSELGLKASDEFIKASNMPAPVYVHVSSLKGGDAQNNLGCLDPNIEDVYVEGERVSSCFKLSSAKLVASNSFMQFLSCGKVLISDASAQSICEHAIKALNETCAKDKLSCLELCAGRGTKTILLQSYMKAISGSQFAEFISVDNVKFKAELLTARAKAYAAHVDKSLCLDATNLRQEAVEKRFDLVFLDAPCSGLGTLRRHPEIRWRLTPELIQRNASLDLALLYEAASLVDSGGILVYSTCTITADENCKVIQTFLESDEGKHFSPLLINGSPYFSTKLHEYGYDAHFCSILRRKALI